MYTMRKVTEEDLKRWASKVWQDDQGQERPVVRIRHQEYRVLSYDEKTKLAIVEFLTGGATYVPVDPEHTWVREFVS